MKSTQRQMYAQLWHTLTTKGYVELTVATHRVQTTIEAVKKRKWRQNVRRQRAGIASYEHMVITQTKLSDAYVKIVFEIPQNYVV